MATLTHDQSGREDQSVLAATFDDREAYWRQHLSGAPTALDLPADRPRPPMSAFQERTLPLTLAGPLTDALRAMGQQVGAPLSSCLLAAFQAVLRRVTDQTEIVIGTSLAPSADAPRSGAGGGAAVPVLLRTNLSDDPPFQDLLERVHGEVAAASAHQGLPVDVLISLLGQASDGSRDPERPPCVHALCILGSADASAAAAVRAWGEAAHVDLALALDEGKTPALRGSIVYNSLLFEDATIARLAGHLWTMLDGVVADPTQPISRLPLLTKREREQLLVEWNRTEAPYPADQCIHTLIEEQVARTPDAVALMFEEQQLTYAQLDARANQLARYLREVGVGPDVLVGLCVERSLEMVVSLLAVLKAGGAYVPLDPSYPTERLAFMLEDARVPILLTQQHLLARLPAYSGRLLCLDRDWEAEVARQGDGPVASGVRPENLAYVIYTSGSTGRPKGVMVTHRGLTNVLWALARKPGVGAGDVMLAVTTLSFDIAAAELLLPLMVGARVALISRSVAIDGEALARAVTALGATILQATPTTWRLLLAAGWPGAPRLAAWCGGEPLPPDLAARLCSRVGCLWNVYGPTETTIWSTTCHIWPGDEISIGWPLANTSLRVLDAHLRPVPIGVPGELYIGGVGVARGYLNRPELTEQRFLPDPFSDLPGARIYKTGDLVRYRADGRLECLGRLDDQVKVRGHRIELGEVESVLMRHPAVRASAVVAREDRPGDTRLVAYVVTLPGTEPGPRAILAHLGASLPQYMVPSAVVSLDALPLTPNGKIDRRALPVPDMTDQRDEYVPAAEPLHQQLIAIWEDLLGVHPIGIRDDFFALGGHSLLIAQLLARIETSTGTRLPLATVFNASTIEDLTRAIHARQVSHLGDDTAIPEEIVAIQADGTKRPIFFMHGNQRGEPWWCLNAARFLGAEQPFYAIRPYKPKADDGVFTLEDAVATQVRALRAIQPEGPYLLGGWCNGAITALEAARQLRAAGHAVDLVVLMEPPTPPRYAVALHRVTTAIGRARNWSTARQLHTFLSAHFILSMLDAGLSYAANSLRHPRQALADVMRVRRLGLMPWVKSHLDTVADVDQVGMGETAPRYDSVLPSAAILHQNWVRLYAWMGAGYVVRPYPGKLALFWARDEPATRGSRALGWRIAAQATAADIHLIPGTAITSRTEQVQRLAEHLQMCLEAAR